MNARDEHDLAVLQAQMTEADFDELESLLKFNAACRGWTGDPLRQPTDVVIRIARSIVEARTTATP